MEMHSKKLQIGMNSAVAVQLCSPKCRDTQLTDRSHTAKQKRSLYSGTTPHMKNVTYNHENIINNVTL